MIWNKFFCLFSCFVLLSSLGFGQLVPLSVLSDSSNFRIQFNSSNSIGGTFLVNQALFKTLRSSDNEIPSETTERIVNRGSALTVAGFITQQASSFEWKADTNRSFYVRLADEVYANASLPNDWIQLIFEGNKPFVGNSATLDNPSIHFLSFQKLAFGTASKMNQWTYNTHIDLVLGRNAFTLEGQRNRLNSEPDGSAFALETMLEASITDTSANGSYYKGWGSAFGGSISYDFNEQKKLHLVFDNIGFIQWQNNSLRYKSNENLGWAGFNIEDVFNPNDSLIKATGPDTLRDALLDERSNSGFVSTLPMQTLICYSVQNEKSVTAYAIRYLWFSNALPELMVNHSQMLAEKWNLRGQFSLGGYNFVNAGIGIAYHTKRFEIELSTANLEGLLLPQRAAGLSAFLQLAYQWK